LIVEWRAAVLEAGPDADRFIRGAKERRKLWLAEFHDKPAATTLIGRSQGVEGLTGVGDVAQVLATIAATPLPVGLVKAEHHFRVPRSENPDSELAADKATVKPASDLAVAFLKFTLNGALAEKTHFLSPGQIHDLEIEVRVSRWPDAAEALELRPLSVEAPDTYEFPIFRLAKPLGEPPYTLNGGGRALLKVGQSLQARPFEFRYSAHFIPNAVEQPVAVVGQRTLRIESIDPRQVSLTGYPHLDIKLLELRESIRSRPLAAPDELANALIVMTSLANFAGRCFQDNLIRETWPEARFQTEIRSELRRNPALGAELEEHPIAAGGVTDLSFRGIRIELKSVRDRRLELADCRQFVGQTVTYAAGSGRRMGILCVLDCSPKVVPPFPAEDGIEGTAGAPVYVLTVLVQANLPRPSDLSR
jgi:hypothetical protein